ncbi:MAG: hypothetical protein ACREP8_05590, partial [Candidatus Binatia bacterium]
AGFIRQINEVIATIIGTAIGVKINGIRVAVTPWAATLVRDGATVAIPAVAYIQTTGCRLTIFRTNNGQVGANKTLSSLRFTTPISTGVANKAGITRFVVGRGAKLASTGDANLVPTTGEIGAIRIDGAGLPNHRKRGF